jgi:hypothetical protein
MADPLYDAVSELAKGHLLQAFVAFKADVRIPWQEMTGNVPKVQHRIWVGALRTH